MRPNSTCTPTLSRPSDATFGAYFGYVLLTRTGSFTVALIAAPLLVGVLGLAMERVLIRPLYGRSPDDPHYRYKLDWLAKVRDFLEEEMKRYPRLVVLGDFNIAPDDRDVYDPVAWGEDVLCSPPERAALKAITDLGLHDSFRLFEQEGGHFSWWDYRQAAFRRNMGLRIDLILVSDVLKSAAKAAAIDRTPRRWERPSDHTPVTLDLDI